jgi:L,D-peptidoglycan transpeptidase YkuD (ErfK/YbiS/YcfS/YnhG family)
MATGAFVALVLGITAGCGAESAAPVTVATTAPSSTAAPETVPDTSLAQAELDGAVGALTTIGSSAAVTSAAERAPVTTPPSTECERIATAIAERHGVRTQQVIVRSGAWTDTAVTLEVATRTSGGWTCGAAMDARVGRSGMRPLLERRSGDGTTPAGVFPLATMTAHDGQRFSFFGNAPDPGVTAGAYRRVETGDCFGATPNTPGYGHLRYDTSCPGPDDEYLPRFVNAYTNAALIGANTEPDVSGDALGETPYAAAIFLHRHVYVNGGTTGATKPTSGCVSLAQADLTSVLVGMTPDTVFAIGTTDWLLRSA